jgi:hypothetical protein
MKGKESTFLSKALNPWIMHVSSPSLIIRTHWCFVFGQFGDVTQVVIFHVFTQIWQYSKFESIILNIHSCCVGLWIFLQFNFFLNSTIFLKQGIYDKMFFFQENSHDGENSPHKKSLNPIHKIPHPSIHP